LPSAPRGHPRYLAEIGALVHSKSDIYLSEMDTRSRIDGIMA
jgi:hypothetical protein